jgi:hypothetical protein
MTDDPKLVALALEYINTTVDPKPSMIIRHVVTETGCRSADVGSLLMHLIEENKISVGRHAIISLKND